MTWGDDESGGDSSPVQDELKEVQRLAVDDINVGGRKEVAVGQK